YACESGVAVAASVAVGSEQYGLPVALHIVGEDRAAAKAAGAISLLDRLAAVQQTSTDDAVALLDLAERAVPGGALVAITGAGEPSTVARLSAQRRRFAPVVVVELHGGTGDPGSTRQQGIAVLRARTGRQAAPV